MNQPWLASFQSFLRDQRLCDPGMRLLLAMSGGADSVLLAYLLKESGYRVRWAHMNFQLRGQESFRDEAFVRELAERWEQPLELQRVDTRTHAEQHGLGIQEAARNLRYAWFEELRVLHSLDRVATAHHLSDQVETLLFNLFKGTGIRGLHGIAMSQGRLIRPLMYLYKSDILRAVGELGLSYVEDSSNASTRYSRNFLRLEVLPKIREQFPQVEQAVQASILRFQEAELLYDQAVQAQLKKLVEQKGREQWVPLHKLLGLVPLNTLCYEWLRPAGFSPSQVDQVLDMARRSESGHVVCSASHRLLKDRAWLILSPLLERSISSFLIGPQDRRMETPDLTLLLEPAEVSDFRVGKDEREVFIDAGLLQYPLLLRRWRTGDYFYPLGMRHQKKLSRFFIDQKLSRLDKERVWVLQDAGGRIVWICGLRLDDRFKVCSNSRKLLHLRLEEAQR